MSWDPIWNDIFKAQSWGKYPPEELIRFIAIHFYQASDRQKINILEIGCGMGANIWFLAREGFNTFGIDGSEIAIQECHRRLKQENLQANLKVGDIFYLEQLYPTNSFDAVIDIGCLQCNRLESIRQILPQIYKLLKPRGYIFSITGAYGSWGTHSGEEIEPGTFINISEGPLRNRGLNHLFTLEELGVLFGKYQNLQIEYSARSMLNRKHEYKTWVIQGTKAE